ncbi:MAG TPA: glycosyltransferase [Fibrobacteria bacterium]|nr:glycosyltransferase [Fibrobacteria bacterium]
MNPFAISIAVCVLVFLSAYSYFVYPAILAGLRMAAPRRAEILALRPARSLNGNQGAHAGKALAGGIASAFMARGISAARLEAAGQTPNSAPSLVLQPTVDTDATLPRVSLIITAYNEEERLPAKLENSLALDYPEDLLEILVASDASTDGTDALALSSPRVRLVRVSERKGKEHAQKTAIRASSGSILVFTDVATRIDPHAVRLLVNDFRDPSVGAVSSEDRVIGDAAGGGEGLYVRYEMLLRRLETEVNSLVGLSGSFFAARREVCRDWAENLPSDFNTVLACARLGYRAVADEAVIGYYPGIRAGQSEFQRKVRTLVRGMAAFFANRELLDIRRYGLFTFQLVSHKLMRWLAPVFMILLLPVSLAAAMAGSLPGTLVLLFQILFHGLAGLGALSPATRGRAVVKVPYFFTQVNLAILAAWIKYLRGERISLWTPSKR